MTRADFVPQGERGARAGHRGAVAHGHVPQIDLLQLLWRSRWVVLLCAGLGVAGGFYCLSRQTPIYSSSSRIYVESDGPKIINTDGGPSVSGNYLATQCELIQSTRILEPVAALPEIGAMKTF